MATANKQEGINMVGTIESPIGTSLYKMADQTMSFLPTLVAVILLAVVGWIAGRIIGKIGANILDRIGLDDLINKTAIGDALKKSNTSIVGAFESIIKWFIYIIFATIIIDMLNIAIVANIIARIILFIPLILTALLVLIIGILAVNFISNLVKVIIVTIGIDDKFAKMSIANALKKSGTTISSLLSGLIKLFGYILVLSISSEIIQLQLLTQFLMGILNYLPHVFTGLLILVIGFLSIDFVIDYLQSTLEGMKVTGIDIVLPALRGFLFLVIILLVLDALLVNTNIFYTFLSPLAWGLAIVVAFKWGIKEALVAYARERKN